MSRDLPSRLIVEMAGAVSEEVNAVLDARDKRLRADIGADISRIERALTLQDRYRQIVEHECFWVVAEALTRDEWVPWEWAETLDVSEPELLIVLDMYRRMLPL